MTLPQLHKAVIDDDKEFIIKNRDLAFQRDRHGFTAKELALLLGKREIARELGYHPPQEILVSNKSMPLTLFEETFGIRYSPSIAFKQYDSLLVTMKECPLTFRFFAGKCKEGNIRMSIDFIDAEIGFGLFCEEPLLKGGYIGEYAGLVMPLAEQKESTYLLHYPTRFFSLHPYVIDARACANLTRFINHSDTPNLTAGFIMDRRLVHIAFFAARNIVKGEELTIDYGKDYWTTRNKKDLLT